MEWTKETYNKAYRDYMPWVEDKVLGYWGENKTSYAAKDNLSTDVTGDKNVNAIQGGVAEGVGGQFQKGGLLGGVGEMTSKEGMNRAEQGQLDADQAAGKQKSWTETMTGGTMGGEKK